MARRIKKSMDVGMLTQLEMTELSLRQLCQRILDIDSECSTKKGCPAHYVAFPMLNAWLNDQKSNDIPEVIRRMLAADGQGRCCEIDEIKYIAKEFLQTINSP